ncbi:hypothetical protein Hanom_Chr04g00347051 [Helianthus anomalus]
MQEIIENQRPPSSVFDTWSGSEHTFFDHITWMGASMERALKHSFDRQESWNHTHSYAFEQEMNNRYIDDQNRRMHADWHAGQPVVVDHLRWIMRHCHLMMVVFRIRHRRYIIHNGWTPDKINSMAIHNKEEVGLEAAHLLLENGRR